MIEMLFKPVPKYRTKTYQAETKEPSSLVRLSRRLRTRLKQGNMIFPMFGIR